MTIDEFLSRLDGAKKAGSGFEAKCPAHDDRQASLSVREGERGVVLHCHAGCTPEAVAEAAGVNLADLFYDARSSEPPITYDYRDEDGQLLFQAVRKPGKVFRQRQHLPGHADADEEGWVWSLGRKGGETKAGIPQPSVPFVRRVLYRLPEVIAAVGEGRRILVCEGEKDADAVVSATGVGTTSPMGAGKWQPEYAETLRGAHVWIIADRDEPGMRHAEQVLESLKDIAKTVEVRQALSGKDAYDHLSAGNRLEDFVPVNTKTDGIVLTRIDAVIAAPPEWVPGFENFIPLAGPTVIAGYPGSFKSTIVCRVAATITGLNRAAVFVSTEDGAGKLRLKLEAAGANLALCHFVTKLEEGEDGMVLFPSDAREIDEAMGRVSAGLLVVDPIAAHYDGAVETHNDSSLRQALAPLKRIAERQNAALIVISHLTKDRTTDPFRRVAGGIGLVGISRAAAIMALHPDDDDQCILAGFKTSWGEKPQSRVFRAEMAPTSGGTLTPRLVDFGVTWHKASDLLREKKGRGGE